MSRLVFLFLLFIPSQKENVGNETYSAEGFASYYAEAFHGLQTANGEIFNMADLSAAHRTLPFNTYLKVTNKNNHLSTLVRINDRGPYAKKRIIDLSEAAARLIGGYKHGITPVSLEEFRFDTLDRETDSLYKNQPVMDCLGNVERLNGISMSVWSTKFLMHALYIANDIFLNENVDLVFVCGKGKGKLRTYHVVLSNIINDTRFRKMKSHYEQKGFIRVEYFK